MKLLKQTKPGVDTEARWLKKAGRYRYANNDMNALEDILKQTQAKRTRLISTDGVFSMDGYLADLPAIRFSK